MIGHCSNCYKIWTLETRQGVCQWCGQPAICQTKRTQALRIKSRSNGRKRQSCPVTDDGYYQLDGEWHTWLEVAKRYEHKVPSQDRYDMRHTIIVELHHARQRDGEPIPILRAYRIASLTVALYWRELNKPLTRVCIIDGLAKEPNNANCGYKDKPSKCRQCPFLAVRPIQSLDQVTADYDGNESRLMDTVADDKAIDLDAWLDASTWLLGCPIRLIEVATKRLDGIPLTGKDRKYLCKMLKRYQKPLF